MASLMLFVTALIVFTSFLLNSKMAWLVLASYTVIAINSGQKPFSFGMLDIV